VALNYLLFKEVLMPRPVHSDKIDYEAGQASSEDGIYLDDLADGAALEVETKHHCYKIVKTAHTRARISGHPRYCPEPVTVEIEGSAGGGTTLKPRFIGRGMHLVFEHPTFHTVTTSRIADVHRIG
jgi:hypothetical protein